MDQEIDRLYAELENVLNEFFSPSTSNVRKQEIESYLNAFQKNTQAQPFVLSCLAKCENEYVLMYFLHVLQTLVDTKWLTLSQNLRVQTRETVFKLLPVFHRSKPAYIFKKASKLYADIGRLDWCSIYPEFFEQIFKEFLNGENNAIFILTLLKVIVEEFSNVDQCFLLSSNQKFALKNGFKTQTGFILAYLDEFVKNSLILFIQPEALKNNFYNDQFYQYVKFECANFNTNLFARLDESHVKTLASALDCLLAICQCADLQQFFDQSHLYDFVKSVAYAGVAMLLDDSLKGSSSDSASSSRCFSDGGSRDHHQWDLTVAAANCLHELAGRNYKLDNHHTFERFSLLHVLNDVMHQLNSLHGPLPHETWLKSVIELMRAFITHHLFCAEESSWEICRQVLENFAHLTHKFKSVELFLQCTDVWHTFFEYMTAQVDRKSEQERNEYLRGKYQGLTGKICCVFMDKITVTNNILIVTDQLEVDFGENYNESDWCQYLTSCCDIILKLADFYPLETFTCLKGGFDTKLIAYINLNQAEIKNFNKNKNDKKHVIHFFQDFECILKALSTISTVFINENFWNFNDQVRDLVEKLCKAIVFSYDSKLYAHNDDQVDEKIIEEASHLFAQFLLCIKCYCHWLAQFYAEAQRTGENNHVVSAIITSTSDTIISLLLNYQQTPPFILHASSSALYSILITVRPQNYFLNMKNVQLLYEEACKPGKLTNLPAEIYRILFCSLCNYLILPWYNAVDCEQEWTHRKKLYQQLMKFISADYLHLCNIHVQAFMDLSSAKHCANFVIPILVEMLDSIANENVATKKQAYAVFKPIATGTLQLMNMVSSTSLTFFEQLLSLTSSLFNVLVVQLGSEFTKETVQLLLKAVKSPNLHVLLKQETSTVCKILELILQILSSITKETKKGFDQFTESIIHLVIENVKPLINQITSIDLKMSFYELIYFILIIRWRYFFPANVLVSVENQLEAAAGDGSGDNWDKVEHEQELLAILQTFGESLSDSQPSVIKQNLVYLNKLNETRNLYKRVVFIKHLYANFVDVLLNMLIRRTHPILCEDFCDTLARMTCAKPEIFQLFRTSLLQKFLTAMGNDLKIEHGGNDNTISLLLLQKFPDDQETPSFSVNLHKFVNDVIVFSLSNGATL